MREKDIIFKSFRFRSRRLKGKAERADLAFKPVVCKRMIKAGLKSRDCWAVKGFERHPTKESQHVE